MVDLRVFAMSSTICGSLDWLNYRHTFFYLRVSSVLVNERDDSSDVLLFDDVKSFGAVYQYTMQHIQNTYTENKL